MVWDPPKQPVNVTRMMIYSLIPILSIYAGWRIQKFWVLLGISILVGIGVGAVTGIAIPEPYGYFVSLAIEIPISLFIVRHYTRKYNEKIAASGPQSL